MVGIGGFLFVLGIAALVTGIFAAAAPVLIVVGLVLAALGLFGGEKSSQFGEGMKEGCGCLVAVVVIAAILLFVIFK